MQLRQHLPAVRQKVAQGASFGVGLRLAAVAGEDLQAPAKLAEFKSFLEENKLYVFTMNGFPYGQFHQTKVKDKVHQPDWQSKERVYYTKNLFRILSQLVPQELDGGISTSPLSYKPWFKSTEELDRALETSVVNLLEIVVFLYKIKVERGIFLHLDIEPEPDGIMENSAEVIRFYNEWLLKRGTPLLTKALEISPSEAEQAIRDHIQVCYDVCHFALVYEEPSIVFQKFKEEGIKVGKIQISAALRTEVGKGNNQGIAELKQFEEDTYLHQVITRDQNGVIKSYNDLPQAFKNCPDSFEGEWRVHFHVPLFIEKYGHLSATQKAVLDTIQVVKQEKMKVHLEVETYTWDVLPDPLKVDIDASIGRELEWVVQNFDH